MEEDKRYYTPDISELYIGYELEAEDMSVGHENGVQWIKCKIEKATDPDRNTHDQIFDPTTLAGIQSRDDVYVRNTFRTPYLNRQDIESCGWEDIRDIDVYMGRPPMYTIGARKGNAMLGYQPKDHTLVITFRDPTRSIDGKTDEYNYPETKNGQFRGECKSVNELRKIMQFIGIK
jgi:hypothetical protein